MPKENNREPGFWKGFAYGFLAVPALGVAASVITIGFAALAGRRVMDRDFGKPNETVLPPE